MEHQGLSASYLTAGPFSRFGSYHTQRNLLKINSSKEIINLIRHGGLSKCNTRNGGEKES